jgi:hypothetical protein
MGFAIGQERGQRNVCYSDVLDLRPLLQPVLMLRSHSMEILLQRCS